MIASDGVVATAGGGLLKLPATVIDGQVWLAGGTVAGGPNVAATVENGGLIAGYGAVSGPVANNGVIAAYGGTLTISDAVTGTGNLAVGSCSTLSLGSDTSETIQFQGFAATLMLAPHIGAHGFLGGFMPGDTIDLAGTKVTSVGLQASGADTLLTAYDQGTAVDTFTIGGHIPQGAIRLSADGAGGTSMTYGFGGFSSWGGLEAWLHGAIQPFTHA